jgi:hypothetical protein
VAFGNPYVDARDSTVGKNTPMWIAIDNTNIIQQDTNRCKSNGSSYCKFWYYSLSETVGSRIRLHRRAYCTFVDPNNGTDARIEARTADGVIGSTSWINRGLGYRTLSTTVTISGNGFSDVIPSGKFIVINDLLEYPGPGANLEIEGLTGSYTLVAID